MIDTLATVTALKDSGIPKDQAVAMTYAMVKALADEHFDAPAYSKALEDVGIPENQVEVMTQGMSDILKLNRQSRSY